MDFDKYQEKARKYDQSSPSGQITDPGFIEKILGLTGEAGETADKIKKIIRDQNGKITLEDKIAIKKELGDVLWYAATIARYLEIPFSDVAKTNLAKLEDRCQRHKISGSGDDR